MYIYNDIYSLVVRERETDRQTETETETEKTLVDTTNFPTSFGRGHSHGHVFFMISKIVVILLTSLSNIYVII